MKKIYKIALCMLCAHASSAAMLGTPGAVDSFGTLTIGYLSKDQMIAFTFECLSVSYIEAYTE